MVQEDECRMNTVAQPRADRQITIDVVLTPSDLDALPQREATTFIVVDVIRATTTLCVLFERGCHSVLLAAGIEAARAARRERHSDALLAGEVGGIAPAGFDHGNSPAEFARSEYGGRDVIFATTNGTRALRACHDGYAVFAGAFRNAGAVAKAAIDAATRTAAIPPGQPLYPIPGGLPDRASEAPIAMTTSDIVIVCSGRGERPAYDDTICAGFIATRIAHQARENGVDVMLHEGVRIASDLSAHVERTTTIRAALARSDAARAIQQVGLDGDLDWCASIDATDIVPALSSQTDEPGLLLMEPLRT